MIRNIFFDLDGTLLPMRDQNAFVSFYLSILSKKVAPYNIEPKLFVKTIFDGVEAMAKSDGTLTNEDNFFKVFCGIFGEEAINLKPVFLDFYEHEFNEAICTTYQNPELIKLVNDLKDEGYNLVLATSPFFPRIAVYNSIKWAGLDKDYFSHISTYEEYHYVKPNPNYYLELLSKLNIDKDDCIHIGNDVSEDYLAASKAGIKTFLLTDCEINAKNVDTSDFNKGDVKALREFIDKTCR